MPKGKAKNKSNLAAENNTGTNFEDNDAVASQSEVAKMVSSVNKQNGRQTRSNSEPSSSNDQSTSGPKKKAKESAAAGRATFQEGDQYVEMEVTGDDFLSEPDMAKDTSQGGRDEADSNEESEEDREEARDQTFEEQAQTPETEGSDRSQSRERRRK